MPLLLCHYAFHVLYMEHYILAIRYVYTIEQLYEPLFIHFPSLLVHKVYYLIEATYGELSPNYSGTVAGIVSAIGNSMGFLSPMIVAAFVDDNVSIPLW